MTIDDIRDSVENLYPIPYLEPSELAERLNMALMRLTALYGIRATLSVKDNSTPAEMPPEALLSTVTVKDNDGQMIRFEVDPSTMEMTFFPLAQYLTLSTVLPSTKYPVAVSYNVDLTLVDPSTYIVPSGADSLLSKMYGAQIDLLYHARDRAAKLSALLPTDDIPTLSEIKQDIALIEQEMEERGGYLNMLTVGG